TVSAANDGVLIGRIGEAEARAKVLVIRIDQSARLQAAGAGEDERSGSGIEVGRLVFGIERRGCEVIAKAHVERELRHDLPVIFKEAGEHPQALVDEVD